MARVFPLPKGTWRVNRSYANHSNLPRAVDLGAATGTPVMAAEDGVVITAVNLTTSYGTHVKIRHANGYITIYAHMIRGSLAVRQGQRVQAGQRLGKLGNTGNSDGPHLHFEVRTPSGGTVDPMVWTSRASQSGAPSGSDKLYVDTGGAKEKREPLPKLKKFKKGSARSPLSVSDLDFAIDGKKRDTDLERLITSAQLDLGVEQVGQLTLVVFDPSLRLLNRDLIGRRLLWDDARWDISADAFTAETALLQLAARSTLARRMRRTYRVVGEHKVGPDEWARRAIRRLGGKAIVEKTSKRGVLPASTDQSLWDAVGGLASDLGWSFVEYGGRLFLGSRTWAVEGGPELPQWAVTWNQRAATDALNVEATLTDDSDTNIAQIDLTLPWAAARRIRPWHTIELSGLGRYDGTYLVEEVNLTIDGATPATISAAIPRKVSAPAKGDNASTSKPPPTKDKRTVAYAQWYARKKMKARYGWDGEHWTALKNLWTRESGWRWNAENPSSGAYGIPQSLPASKMASAGRDYRTNPETQIDWGLGYIKGRYGTPARAWAHFQANNWY